MPRLADAGAGRGAGGADASQGGDAPSHRLAARGGRGLFPGRPIAPPSPVLQAGDYAELLCCRSAKVRAWTTDYLQMLDPVPKGHPVRAFTESTAMRPVRGRA